MGQAAYASAWMPDETVQSPGARLVDPAVTQDQKTYALIMHLSLIATHFVPFALVFAPLIMWQIKKTESPYIDDQGREVVNFQLSLFLYSLAIIPLAIITLGLAAIILVPAVYFLAIFGMIKGAIAASKGEYFRYPATIRLI
jgi:uncharacterized Tic20 family protein